MCGAPAGQPAVVLHGGPGSGCDPGWRRYFNPDAYRVVLFDQRGCGRSRPHAGDLSVDLSTNTTQHLIGDLEQLRHHLEIERWLVFGGSWGSTLGLAYSEQHPECVSELVLFSVVTTTRREVQWVTRDIGRFFPEAWARFRRGVAAYERDHTLPDAYARLLAHPDPAVRGRAATDWCAWEAAHVALTADEPPDPRYRDARFRLCFARLVTHYWRHAAFLDDGQLLDQAQQLAGIPGVLVHGRLDLGSPLDIPWRLSQAWPDAELILLDTAGHRPDQAMTEVLVAATDRFASP
jgi:proline iminopeptidase